jgi:hypothetical protein
VKAARVLIVLVSLAWPPAAFATDCSSARDAIDPIEADRPGLSDPPAVLKNRVAQLEVGIDLTHVGPNRDERSLPVAAVRYGFGHGVEGRVITDGFIGKTDAARGRMIWGRADTSFGAKIMLADQCRHHVDLAAIPFLSVPVGSDGTSSGHVDPAVKLTWQRPLPHRFQTAGEAVIASESDELGHVWQRGVGLGLSRDIGRGVNGFGEIHANSPAERSSGPDWTFDTGVSRGVTSDLQLDISVGRGLSTAASDWFLAAGVVVRHRPTR